MNQIRVLREDSTSVIPYLRARGVTHVALGSVGVRSLRYGKLIAIVCQDLILLREFADDDAVLRVRGADEPTDGGAACRALAPRRNREPLPERRERVRRANVAPANESSAGPEAAR